MLLAGVVSIAAALTLWAMWTITGRYRNAIFAADQLDAVPSYEVAIVFGAGYWPNGALSAILQDRLDAAIELYRQEKVQILLFSGDNRFVSYNEPGKMLEYALMHGVPREDIVLDYAGRRTYDTCYRARDIFQVDGAILVTQRYHLPRAIATCRGLGLDVVGYRADRQAYPRRSIAWYWVREIPALWRTWWDVHVLRPLPVLGDPIPIISRHQAPLDADHHWLSLRAAAQSHEKG